MSDAPDRVDAHWRWRADNRRLEIVSPAGGLLADLGGDWTLKDFGVVLEGLSKARLGRDLKGRRPVDCRLQLSDGRRVRLFQTSEAGQRDRDGVAALIAPVAAAPASAGAKELTPVFQPIIDLATGDVAGFEALARGSRSADEAGDIDQAGLAATMLIHACEALAGWRKRTGRGELFVNVNFTGQDLADPRAPGLISGLIDRHGLGRGDLRVELTEQAALRDAERAISAVEALKRAGAGVVLDDFGSGHSSLAWLADIPADGLKLDGDLIARLGRPRANIVIEAATLMADRLKMTVTAEGVERRADAPRLRALGVGFVQGFAFAKPMTAADATAFLKSS